MAGPKHDIQTDPSSKDDSGFLVNSDDKQIHWKIWKKEGDWKPRALVYIAHGAGEHCLWYGSLADTLVDIGCLVFSHDHVGHGQSEGDRVHVENFQWYTKDVFLHCDLRKKEHPSLPLFIIGHSMGGTIALLSSFERPKYFQGIILIAAAVIASPEAATPFMMFMAKLAARFFPQLQVSKLDPKATSRDNDVVKRYEEDPLVWHGGMKARWAVSILDAMAHIQENMKAIDWPMLILHGDEDKLCDISGSHLLNDKATSKDKTLKVYEGCYHQLHNEPDHDGETVRRDIKEWIATRI